MPDCCILGKRIDEAGKYYEKALGETVNIYDVQIIVRIYLGLARVCIEQKNYYEAREHLDKAHLASSKIDSKRYKAETYALRGKVNEAEKKYPEALQSYGLAVFLFREVGNKHGIAHMEEAVGTIYAKLNIKERALEYLNRAKKKYTSFASEMDLKDIDKKIADLMLQDKT